MTCKEGWRPVLEKLKQWLGTIKNRELVVRAYGVLKKAAPAVAPQTLVAAPGRRRPVPISSMVPEQPASTATKQQLVELPAVVASLEEIVNPGTQLTLKWRWKLNQCRNWKGDLRGLCFVDSDRNIYENHLPIKSEHLLSWAASIAAKRCTAEKPPRKLYKAMIEAKVSSRTRHGKSLSSALRRQSDGSNQGQF